MSVLPNERLEWVEGWGMAVGGAGYVFRPQEPAGVAEALELAQSENVPVALRGSGCSYGDAALGSENIVLDLSGLDRVLRWDSEIGIIDVGKFPQDDVGRSAAGLREAVGIGHV